MKISTLLLTTLLGVGVMPVYSGVYEGSLKKSENPFYNGACTSVTLNGKSYRIGEVHGHPIATRASKDDVIYEAEGKDQLYLKNSAGTALLGGDMILYEDEFPATVVWGENDEVYFKDILSTIPTETYIKGTLKDDVITFAAGQLVDYIQEEGYPDYGLAIGITRTVINEEANTVDFYYDPSVTEYSIKVNKDGSMSLQLPGEPFDGENPTEYVLSLYYTDEDKFAGFSDFMQEYTPKDYVAMTMPFGVEPDQYVYIDDYDYAAFVNVVYTDNYIYLQGLDPMLPEGVIRAKIIDDSTAIVDQNQYVGIYMGMYFIFTKVALDNPDYDPFRPSTKPYIFAPEDQGFMLKYNREEGFIASENKGVYLSFQPDVNNFNNVNCFLEDFVMRYQATSAGTPANPSGLRYYSAQAGYWGFTDFQFTISNYSIDGLVLDAEHLYYQVLVNGEPIIFREAPLINLNGEEVIAYTGVVGEQRWLPYLFVNTVDIDKWNVNMFDIGIYEPDVKTLGVQSMYFYDNKFTYSNIMTLDVKTGEVTESSPTGAVDSIAGEEIIGEEYFTLSGLKVEQPQNGIFVKRTIYSNGKVATAKQLIR